MPLSFVIGRSNIRRFTALGVTFLFVAPLPMERSLGAASGPNSFAYVAYNTEALMPRLTHSLNDRSATVAQLEAEVLRMNDSQIADALNNTPNEIACIWWAILQGVWNDLSDNQRYEAMKHGRVSPNQDAFVGSLLLFLNAQDFNPHWLDGVRGSILRLLWNNPASVSAEHIRLWAAFLIWLENAAVNAGQPRESLFVEWWFFKGCQDAIAAFCSLAQQAGWKERGMQSREHTLSLSFDIAEGILPVFLRVLELFVTDIRLKQHSEHVLLARAQVRGPYYREVVMNFPFLLAQFLTTPTTWTQLWNNVISASEYGAQALDWSILRDPSDHFLKKQGLERFMNMMSVWRNFTHRAMWVQAEASTTAAMMMPPRTVWQLNVLSWLNKLPDGTVYAISSDTDENFNMGEEFARIAKTLILEEARTVKDGDPNPAFPPDLDLSNPNIDVVKVALYLDVRRRRLKMNETVPLCSRIGELEKYWDELQTQVGYRMPGSPALRVVEEMLLDRSIPFSSLIDEILKYLEKLRADWVDENEMLGNSTVVGQYLPDLSRFLNNMGDLKHLPFSAQLRPEAVRFYGHRLPQRSP